MHLSFATTQLLLVRASSVYGVRSVCSVHNSSKAIDCIFDCLTDCTALTELSILGHIRVERFTTPLSLEFLPRLRYLHIHIDAAFTCDEAQQLCATLSPAIAHLALAMHLLSGPLALPSLITQRMPHLTLCNGRRQYTANDSRSAICLPVSPLAQRSQS